MTQATEQDQSIKKKLKKVIFSKPDKQTLWIIHLIEWTLLISIIVIMLYTIYKHGFCPQPEITLSPRQQLWYENLTNLTIGMNK